MLSPLLKLNQPLNCADENILQAKQTTNREQCSTGSMFEYNLKCFISQFVSLYSVLNITDCSRTQFIGQNVGKHIFSSCIYGPLRSSMLHYLGIVHCNLKVKFKALIGKDTKKIQRIANFA